MTQFQFPYLLVSTYFHHGALSQEKCSCEKTLFFPTSILDSLWFSLNTIKRCSLLCYRDTSFSLSRLLVLYSDSSLSLRNKTSLVPKVCSFTKKTIPLISLHVKAIPFSKYMEFWPSLPPAVSKETSCIRNT